MRQKEKDLTSGNILSAILLFALPMILGNMLQQIYNIADTFIVGRFIGPLVLTIISLGTRVLLAYTFAPNTSLGVLAIWWAIPIGWFLADLVGFTVMKLRRHQEEHKNGT